LKSVGSADCDYELPYTKLLGVAESGGGKAGFVYTRVVDANHSQVARGIVADGGCGHAAAVSQGDFNSAGAVYDVAVGEDQPVGSEDEPGASAAAFARFAGAGASGGLRDFDVDYGWADAIDCARDGARVGVKQGIIGT
jgi:hypothetical protein